METTERIVEAYVRYIKRWATIPNIRCAGQNEIDLIAIDPVTLERYHIEVSVSISQGFRKLTAKPFDAEKVKQRLHQASQRRTLGFFIERKFSPPSVVEKLREHGFTPGSYKRIIVTWGWDDAALEEAEAADIELWDFSAINREIAGAITGSREYFADDTLRTLNLFIHANAEPRTKPARNADTGSSPTRAVPMPGTGEGFWVYENHPNNRATVHDGSCSYCNHGHGMHAGSGDANGEWHGPFASADDACDRARQTKRRDVRRCGHCLPPLPDQA